MSIVPTPSITTVIAKPTKDCNADCAYCSTPPDGKGNWTVDSFKRNFEKIAPWMTQKATIVWHGGEPMLLGPDFYEKTFEFAKTLVPNIDFAMQTNILGYSSAKWKDTIHGVFKGRISSSYDPDEKHRTMKGNPATYSRVFFRNLDQVIKDDIGIMIIGTYTENSAHLGMNMYETAKSYGEKTFGLRFNYRYPVGRDYAAGETILPETYGKMLIDLYDRWIRETPSFRITPLDQMLLKTLGEDSSRCPWTNNCGGRFLGIDPDWSVYNCAEFGSLAANMRSNGENDIYRYGNLETDSIEDILNSKAAAVMRRRRVKLPFDCTTCEHFRECEGGCMRDALLYEHGLGGKFHYCQSWKMVFSRIKESVISGEADEIIKRYGGDASKSKKNLTAKMPLFIKPVPVEA